MPITTPPTGLNAKDELIDHPDQAVKNIRHYPRELDESPELVRRMKLMHHWCAIESGGEWLFAPSTFVGYKDNTADDYLEGAKRGRSGGDAGETLAQWFEIAPDYQNTELHCNLQKFLKKYGHSGAHDQAKIYILKPADR